MRVAKLEHLFAAVFLCAASAQAATIEEFEAADWAGLALSNDQTGKLDSCVVFAEYENGATLMFFARPDGGWELGLANSAWTLDPAVKYPVSYRVDRRNATSAQGVPFGPETNQFSVILDADDPLIDQVRRGKLLTVTFQEQDLGFDLGNSTRALTAARDCVARNRDYQAPGTEVANAPAADGASVEAAAPAQNARGASGAGENAVPEEAAGSPETAGAATVPIEPGPESAVEAAAENSEAADMAAAPEPEAGAASDAGAEASTIGDEERFGPWAVTATADADGAFANCTAFGIFGEDQLILSYRPDGKWEFGLYRAGWSLDTNQTYYLWYNVDTPADGEGVTKRPVEAPEPTRIFFEVSELDTIIERMETGRQLNLQLRGFQMEPEAHSYDLDQIGPALGAARTCTERNSTDPAAEAAGEAAANGVESAAPEPPAVEPMAEAAADGGGSDANASAERDTDTPDDAEGQPATALLTFGETELEPFEAPGWETGAYSDAAGRFSHCGISAAYENGTVLGFARMTGGALAMTLAREDWNFDPGATIAVEYQFDGGLRIKMSAQGQVVDASTIAVDLGADPMTSDQLAKAPELVVDTEGDPLTFNIGDIAPGLQAIDACAARHKEPAGEAARDEAASETASEEPAAKEPAEQSVGASTPASGANSNAQSDASAAVIDSPELRTEAAGYTTALLLRSGYPAHVILQGDAVPEQVRNRHAAWRIENVLGVTDVVGGEIAEIRAELARSDGEGCKGTLETRVLSERPDGASHILSFCDAAEGDVPVHYVLARREAGGFYHLSFIGMADAASVEAIAGRVFATLAGS